MLSHLTYQEGEAELHKPFPGLRAEKIKSESHSTMSDSLRPHGLYSTLNFPGQNTGVGSLSLLQEISQPRDQTQVSYIAARLFTS